MPNNHQFYFRDNQILIRRASLADSKDLLRISRCSFPDSFRWLAGSNYGISFWQFMIESAYCETWVCQCEGKNAGFIILILSPQSFNNEKAKYKMKSWAYLPVILRHPLISLKRLYKRHALRSLCGQVPNINRHLTIVDNPLWIELIAVLPDQRRKGLGRLLLTFCERRAFDLGRQAIKLKVLQVNRSALRFYLQLGFSITAELKDSFNCTKTLNI